MSLKITTSASAINAIGLEVIGRIRANTLAGRDKNGSPFKAYSTKDFGMPAGAVGKQLLAELDDSGHIEWYKKESGASWVIILGGYAKYKATKRKGDGGAVNLSDTGQMLRSMTITHSGEGSVTIGFSNTDAANKAYWNIERGRDFMGIPMKEIEELVYNWADELIEIRGV